MTAENTNPHEEESLLARIARTVDSIDRNVEQILDQLSEHFEDVRLHQEWQSHGYDLTPSD